MKQCCTSCNSIVTIYIKLTKTDSNSYIDRSTNKSNNNRSFETLKMKNSCMAQIILNN